MTPRLLWTPSMEMARDSNLVHFMHWLKRERGLDFNDYQSLWEWSTKRLDEFWESLWDYFGVIHDGDYETVLSGTTLPHFRWFEGTRLNYAEHVFQKYDESKPAI